MKWTSKDEVNQIITGLGDISFQDQNVLITGGAGFLGSWMCDVLVAQEARVVCLDNLASGLVSNIEHLLELDGFRFVEHDITKPIEFKERFDLVIHMASRASPFEFEKYPIQILKANTIGTINALGIAKRHGARLLYTSTSEIYGNPSIVPTPESYHGDVNSVGPRGCYDEAKRCGEAYVVAYRKQHGLDTRIARIFNTYGPRIRLDGIYARAVPRFICQALRGDPITIFGDGTQTRSFCYVSDQIEGLVRLAAHHDVAGSVMNIGSDEEIKILSLAKMVLEITASRSTITYQQLPLDDPLRRRPDITSAKAVLGWHPKATLEHGLRSTIEWIKIQLNQ